MATVYESSIDQEQINGAFALAVDVRFDDLSAGPDQKVFDLNNGDGVDNIWFGQVGTSNDIEFVIVKGGIEYRVVAENAIVEGEYATWRVGVDREGEMRIAKNTDLLVEEAKGPGAVPADVDRINYQIGESSDPSDADLTGVVLNMKLANYGDVDQLGTDAEESPCAITGEATCLCDKLYPDGVVAPGNPGIVNVSTTDAEGDGEWSDAQSLGVIAIHSIVLPDGKVLSFGTNEAGIQGAQFVYSLYDPETGIDKILPNTTPTDIFCSNMSIDPSTGNVIIMGGDERGEPGGTVNHGVNDVVVFDYRTETIRTAEQGEMAFARWYGTSINLPNGEILHIGGRNDTGGASFIPEIFNPETGFRSLTGANMTDLGGATYFPHTWVNSRGEVIILESGGRDIFRLSTEGNGSYQKIGTFPFTSAGQQPSIMYDQDMVARIANDGGLWVADISEAVPTFTRVAQLSGARYDGGMSVLPDGRVAITGGGTRYNDLNNAVYTVEIWDPSDNSVIEQADANLARLYHSSHILLPDGTVFVGGGGAPGPLVNTNFEVYAPSYLYDENGNLADRPDIREAPSNVTAGDTFQMSVDDAAALDKVTVVKSGAMTHGRNADARFLELDFTVVDANTIEVSTPNNFIMTPGLWMLFTVDDNGVPSEGSMLGVNMAQLVDTPNFETRDMQLTAYGIDDDQINGAFELTVEARFDDLSSGNWQRVFDFGNGPSQDNILLTQFGGSNDMRFDVYVGTTRYSITAADAIDEGVLAKWTVNVDAAGYMRMFKDDVLVAEGQGAVPRDVARTSNLVGQSNWSSDDSLVGEVRFLETVNEGDQPEYVHLGLPRATLLGPDSVVEGDAGETGQITYTLQLDRPAQNVVTADIVITGDATAPTQVVVPSGQQSASFTVSYQGDNEIEQGETVSVSLQNLSQAWATTALSVTTEITNDDDETGPLDSEPNETFATAFDLGSAAAIGTIEGLGITSASDLDYFKFTATETGLLDVSIAFSHADGDLELVAYDSTGATLASAYSGDDNEALSINTVQGQTYIVEVFGSAGAIADYAMTVGETSDPGGPDPATYEPNNTLATAANLGASNTIGTIDGLAISSSSDLDYFKFTASESGLLDISIAFAHADGDLELIAYDSLGTSLAGAFSGDDNEALTINAVQDQTYIVEVFGSAGARADYTLTIGADGDPGTGPEPGTYEPNESLATAIDLGSADTIGTINGLGIASASDVDYFKFTASETGTVNLSIDFIHADGDLELEAFDGTGAYLAGAYSGDDDETLSIDVAAGNTYYLDVFGSAGAIADYALTVENAGSGPGGPAPGDALETNNTFASASDIGVLNDAALTINDLSLHTANDIDYFKFTAAQNGSVDVGIDFTHANGDLELVAFDGAQNVLATAFSGNDNENLTIDVTAGDAYYIEVFGSLGAINDYSLDLDLNPIL